MQNIQKNIEPHKLILGISAIILLILLGYFQTKRQELEFIDTPTQKTEQSDMVNMQTEEQTQEPSLLPTETATPPATSPSDKESFNRKGTLLTSDNPNRGNIMLQTSTGTFYFRTSRDYSSLLGKSVIVQGKGSIEQFSLVDIIESK